LVLVEEGGAAGGGRNARWGEKEKRNIEKEGEKSN
jgi:hypothetical protein